jgi:hypothetical protein
MLVLMMMMRGVFLSILPSMMVVRHLVNRGERRPGEPNQPRRISVARRIRVAR